MKILLATLSVSALLCSPAAGADLTIDGGTAAAVPYGGSFQLEVTGGAGLPTFVFADGSPGPTFLFGQSIPLGFTPLMTMVVAGMTDGAGSFKTPFFLAEDPTHTGVTLYLCGVLLDPSEPSGLDISNGASMSIVPKAGAGVAQSTLVGRMTAMDGSAATLADGTLAPGTTLLWQVTSRPAGSVAALNDPLGLFPTLEPDVPGDYTVEVTVSKGGVSNTQQTVMHAYQVNVNPSLDGQYTFGSTFSVQGYVSGPGLASASLNGGALALTSGGGFGPITETVPAGEVFHPLLFELSHGDGSMTRERLTMGHGLGLPMGFKTTKSLAARLGGAGYDLIEASAGDLIADADIASLLLSGGPVQIAYEEGLFGFVIFSATLDFLGMSYSSITVDLAPSAAGVSGLVNVNNVNVDFEVYGKILEIPYSLTGDMQTNPAHISATLALSPAGGELKATMQSLSVDLQNFNFDLDGFLGGVAELFIIESAVKGDVEQVVYDTINAELPPAIEEILSSFVIASNLYDALEVDVDVFAPISGVDSDASGTTLQLDGQVTVASVEPGSPVVTQYLSTLTTPPVFGSSTPSGLPYGAGLAVADDFINQILAACTGAGLLDGDMTTLFEGTKGAGELFFTDVLSVLFPGAGFEKFPAGTQVSLRAYGTMPPILRMTAGGATLGRIDMSDLEVVFGVDGVAGTVAILRVSLDAGAELDLTIGGNGLLTANLGEAEVTGSAIQGMPGASLTLLNQGITFLEGVLVPQLTKLFEGIPLPSLEAQGIGITPTEVGLMGGGLEYAGFYGDLFLVPLP